MNNPSIDPIYNRIVNPFANLPQNVMPGVVETTPRGDRF